MSHVREESGFTIVELIITLFVAVAFLVSGYQLYNVIIKDGGQTRAEARASNVAYDYLRRYTPSATNPCSASTPINGAAVSISGLSAATVTVGLSCPYGSSPSLTKVTVTITYNTPAQTMTYSTLFAGNGVVASTVAPTGLLGWWKFNGDATDSSGQGKNGTVTAASLTTGQNGQANGAYSFNGSNAYISVPSGFADFSNGMTLSLWANPTSNASYQRFIDFAAAANDVNAIAFYRASTTNYLQFYNDNNTLTTIVNGIIQNSWHHYVASQMANGTYAIYRDGVQIGGGSGGIPTNTTRVLNYFGRSTYASDAYFSGAMDDIRIYNRALSATEVSSLYSLGAQ